MRYGTHDEHGIARTERLTHAEYRLWQTLGRYSGWPIHGVRWWVRRRLRRDVRDAGEVACFYQPGARLAVQVGDPNAVALEADAQLRMRGYNVFRVADEHALRDTDRVLERLARRWRTCAYLHGVSE